MGNRIGPDNFRTIHYASYLAFAGSAVHGMLSGTDSPLRATQFMYLGTGLVVGFLTAYRILIEVGAKEEPKAKQVAKKPAR